MTAYDEQYLIVSNSNYIDWERYDQLQMSFISGENYFSYQYIWSVGNEKIMIKSGTNNVLGKIKVKEICLQGSKIWNLNIKLTPYQLGCTLNDQEWTAIIKIWVNNDREDKCFKISSQVWRLVSISCPEVCSKFSAVPANTPSDALPETFDK